MLPNNSPDRPVNWFTVADHALIKMLLSRTLAAGLLSLPLTVCAVAQDAYGDGEIRRLMARPGRLLFDEEVRGNCAGLTVTIKTRIDRLRELHKQAKKEQEGPPPTLFAWFERSPAATDLAKERDRVEALNVALDAKGCNPSISKKNCKRCPHRHPKRRSSSRSCDPGEADPVFTNAASATLARLSPRK